MASTYSTNLAIELIGTGEQAGTWGVTTNTNLGTLIEQAISGYVTQAVSTGTTTTITIPNGATGVARNMYIELTGTGGTNTFLEVPANRKLYFIFNNSTGAVTVRVTGQTGVSVAAGEKKIVVSNGTDIVEATSYISANASSASITNLNVTSANITTLTSASGTITNLLATNASFGSASLSNADILSAVIGSATITGAGITSAAITTLTGTTASYASASLTAATVTTLVGTTASYASASLTAATVTTLVGTTASYGSASLTGLNAVSAQLTKFTAGSSAVSNLLASGAITAVGNISTSGNLSASGSITASSGVITQFNSTSATITTLRATSATIDNVSLTSIVLTNATITSANITTLTGTTLGYASASVTTLTGTTIGAALSSTILGLSGSITNLNSTSANIATLTGTTVSYGSASLTGLNAVSANIATLTGTTFGTTATTQLRGASGAITTLTGTSADITTITGLTIGTTASSTIRGVSGAITTLTGTSADIATITGVTIGNTTSSNIRGVSGQINQLTSTSATITTLSGTTVGYASASLTNASVSQLTVTSGTVTNLASTSSVITTLTNTTLNSGSASITVLTGGNITFTSGTITNLVTTSFTVTNTNFTSATIVNLSSTSAVITTLNGTSADITTITGTTIGTTASATLRGVSGAITTLTGTTLGYASASITTVTGTTIGAALSSTVLAISGAITTLSGTTLNYGSASITTLTGSSMNVTTATHTSANITTLGGTTLGYASASITTVTGTTIGAALSSTILGLSGSITNFNATSAALAKFTAGSSAVSNLLASGAITALGNISSSGNISASGSITGSSGVITQFTSTSATITTLAGTTIGTQAATQLRAASAAITNITSESANVSQLTVVAAAIFSAGTAAAPAITTTGDTNTGIFFPAADTIAFAEGGVESARLDSAGNFGLGVTPSAWSGYKALQMAGGGSFVSVGNAAEVWSNAFFNGTNNVYIANGFATRYHANNNGAHAWYNAPSGSAGGTISFTQAMTLTAAGNLLVGGTVSRNRLTVNGLVTDTPTLGTAGGAALLCNTDSNYGMMFGTSGFGYGWIQQQRVDGTATAYDLLLQPVGGNVGIGTTSPAAGLHVANGNVRLTNGSAFTTGNALIREINAAAGSSNQFVTSSIGFRTDAFVDSGIITFGTASAASTPTERMRITADGYLALGDTVIMGSTNRASFTNNVSAKGVLALRSTSTSGYSATELYDSAGTQQGAVGWGNASVAVTGAASAVYMYSTGAITFLAGGTTERARITSGGVFCVGTTNVSPAANNVVGIALDGSNGVGHFSREGAAALTVNRKTNDGDLVIFYQDGTSEGSISVSGNTVSYNAFAGSHWSQLQDGSKPDILRGTVMESINELCEWPDETNERLPKAKVSDTAGSKKVYGVFMAWDNDWTETNDMYVTAVGAFICRVNGSVTVQEGDLLESNGDGTARVQADDIIRSSTIGKVTSTVKTHQYDDGSYCVPTALYCG